ncbi:DUF488 family protein [Planomonospora alba]|uniref:DUF488 family protein n=1 Tax=Planomonospora alba TaxID=161354 RepID=A0ABP6N083_9ACTN
MPSHVRLRRVYDAPSPEDGARVLVDRIWPRGLSKREARLDLWLKEVAPSTELRTWYGHAPERFDGFRDRYLGELAGDERRAALDRLRELRRDGTVTLLTATRDAGRSHAAVLAALLDEPGDRSPAGP